MYQTFIVGLLLTSVILFDASTGVRFVRFRKGIWLAVVIVNCIRSLFAVSTWTCDSHLSEAACTFLIDRQAGILRDLLLFLLQDALHLALVTNSLAHVKVNLKQEVLVSTSPPAAPSSQASRRPTQEDIVELHKV